MPKKMSQTPAHKRQRSQPDEQVKPDDGRRKDQWQRDQRLHCDAQWPSSGRDPPRQRQRYCKQDKGGHTREA